MKYHIIILLFIGTIILPAQTLEVIRITQKKELIQAIIGLISNRIIEQSPIAINKLREEDSISFAKIYPLMKSKMNVDYSTKYIEKELQIHGAGSHNLEYQVIFYGMICTSLIIDGKINEIVLYFDHNTFLNDMYLLTNDNKKIVLKESQLKALRIKRSELEIKGLLLPLSIKQ